ncbi:hypothetical protein AMTRI_Chr04g190540 [Amborella trichopoda]
MLHASAKGVLLTGDGKLVISLNEEMTPHASLKVSSWNIYSQPRPYMSKLEIPDSETMASIQETQNKYKKKKKLTRIF